MGGERDRERGERAELRQTGVAAGLRIVRPRTRAAAWEPSWWQRQCATAPHVLCSWVPPNTDSNSLWETLSERRHGAPLGLHPVLQAAERLVSAGELHAVYLGLTLVEQFFLGGCLHLLWGFAPPSLFLPGPELFLNPLVSALLFNQSH